MNSLKMTAITNAGYICGALSVHISHWLSLPWRDPDRLLTRVERLKVTDVTGLTIPEINP